jgi:hypothetical protein
MLRRVSLRSVGRFMFAVGLIALAVGLPAYAWTTQNDSESFNRQVGWATIFATSIGAVGLLMMTTGKDKCKIDVLNRRVVSLARAQRTSHSKQFAQLLGTDSLESRSAKLEFVAADPRTGKSPRNERTAGSIDTVGDYYRQSTSGRMLILGAAGAGKSVISIALLLQLVDEVLTCDRDGKELRVPVIFNLTSWPSGRELDDWLADTMSMRFRLSSATARELVRDQRIIPILDGLDEMDNETESPDRAERAVGQINDYIAVNRHVSLVVVGRSGSRYYSRLRVKIRNAKAIAIKSVAYKEIERYVGEHCGQDVLNTVRRGLMAGPRKAREAFYSAVSTPWRLAMTVGYINSGKDPRRLLPVASEGRADFAARLDRELYETFLSTRMRLGGCKDERQTDRRRRSLSSIAHLLCSPNSDDQSSDIVLHDWWRRFGISVPAWQSRVALVAAILPFALPLGRLPLEGYSPDPDAGWISRAMPLANLMMLVTLALLTPYIVKRPSGISLSRFLSSTGVLRAFLLLIPSAGVGYVIFVTTSSGLLGAVAAIGVFALLVSVLGFRTEVTKDATSPQAPIRRDLTASLIFGVGMGTMMGVNSAGLMGAQLGLQFAVGYFLAMTVGFASGRYMVATWLGGSAGLPIRLSAHLRWATHAGILRASGISYQFRHREIMNYLRESSDPPPQVPLPGPFGIPMRRMPRWLERKSAM